MDQNNSNIDTYKSLRAYLNRRDFLRLVGTGVSLVALNEILAACGMNPLPTEIVSTDDITTNATLTFPINTSVEVSLDPHRAGNAMFFFNLFDYIYGGLVKYDKDAKVIPDLAESWDISPDGLVYTFHLRDGIKFASGQPVTPEDFIYSWKRSLDPKTPSPVASFMAHLVGYDEFTKGQTSELAGVKKIDDKTIELTISKPYNFFLSYLCTYAWYVVDKVLVEKFGDSNNSSWANNQPYGTGAWKVSKFDPAVGIEMEQNSNYWGGLSPSVVKLNWPILKGPTAANQAVNLYKGDQADIVSTFPISLLDAVGDYKNEVISVVVAGTDCIAMSFAHKPFDNILVRLAFAMAIDRDTYCNVIWRGAYTPTDYFTPPSVKNYTPPAGIKYNLEEAKKVLAAAGFPNGQGLPPIKFRVTSDTSADDVNRYRALADMWNKGLGADVQVDNSLTFDQIIEQWVNEKGFQMHDMGWTSITETPQLLSEVFRIDSEYMKDRFDFGLSVPKMSYGGVEYDPATDAKQADDLLAKADVEQDPRKRNDLYAQAEALILKNAAYVPFGNFVMFELVKPNIKGLEWGGFFHVYPRSIDKNVVVLK